jgi:hypothetical protein
MWPRAEDVRDLFARELLEIPEHDGGPLARGERLESAPDGIDAFAREKRRLAESTAVLELAAFEGHAGAGAARAAAGIPADVHRDPIEPGAEILVFAEPPQILEDPEEDFLRRVPRELTVSEHAAGEPQDLLLGRDHETFEGLGVAGPGFHDQGQERACGRRLGQGPV